MNLFKIKNVFHGFQIYFTLFIVCQNKLISQDGSLDLSFNQDGMVTTTTGSNNDFGKSVIVQTDGKILLTGHSGNNFTIVRYNTHGDLDNEFGSGGIVSTNLRCANGVANSIALQRDNKIVVGGYCGIFPNYDFTVVRYNSDGTLDVTFDSDGIVITALGNSGDLGRAVAIQPDGKILLGGSIDNGSNSDLALIRYNVNGSLDTTFDHDGIVTLAIGSSGDIIRTVYIQEDKKILVAGFSYVTSSFSYDFVLVRLKSDGSLDDMFGKGGVITTDIVRHSNDYGEAIAIQKDYKIIVAGYSFTGSIVLARYLNSGVLDNTFGIQGTISTPFGCAYQNDYAVALQSDDKIIVAGYSNPNKTNSDFAMVRYTNDGNLDSTMGSFGIVTTPIGIGEDIATSITLQRDGKIILAGRTFNGANFDFALTRYNNTIVSNTKINEHQSNELRIFPNPFSSQATLEYKHNSNLHAVTIFNSLGQKVFPTIKHIGQTSILNRGNLYRGLYFIRLEFEKSVIATGKFMVTD